MDVNIINIHLLWIFMQVFWLFAISVKIVQIFFAWDEEIGYFCDKILIDICHDINRR